MALPSRGPAAARPHGPDRTVGIRSQAKARGVRELEMLFDAVCAPSEGLDQASLFDLLGRIGLIRPTAARHATPIATPVCGAGGADPRAPGSPAVARRLEAQLSAEAHAEAHAENDLVRQLWGALSAGAPRRRRSEDEPTHDKQYTAPKGAEGVDTPKANPQPSPHDTAPQG